jgi:signal transduction histidine kinase
MSFSPVQVILSEAVEEVINVLFSLAYRKQIEIDNLVKHGVTLFADKNMLNTILNNLIMNAIKFTHVGGEIKIFSKTDTSETDKDFIMISVADTGIGMDAETCKTLFKLNRMVSKPGTEKELGTGLGLVLVREMVEKHGGKIMVESSPGKGSVFSFLIPVYKSGNNS